jgi:hypothetical protein
LVHHSYFYMQHVLRMPLPALSGITALIMKQHSISKLTKKITKWKQKLDIHILHKCIFVVFLPGLGLGEEKNSKGNYIERYL